MTDSENIEGFAAILAERLGSDAVMAPGSAGLDAYADPFSFSGSGDGETETESPRAAVLPRSVEEIQLILEIARAHSVPLWVVSRGRNLGYGGAQPSDPRSIVLDLSRMDRVIAVDERCAYAVVEPGVSFAALDEHLRAHGSSLTISVPDLSWGSVIGNALERGFGYAAHADHSAWQCGMEVVLADGQVVRTGMGAMDGNSSWALYKGGYGPSLDGLFFQSNLGIVTKMGVWLMPRTASQAVGMITTDSDERLGPLMELLRPLLLDGTIQSNVLLANLVAAGSKVSPRSRWYGGRGTMPSAARAEMMAELGIGFWNARFGLYGSAELVQARADIVSRAVSRCEGLDLRLTHYHEPVDRATVPAPDRAQLGIPSLEPIQMAAWRGGGPGHVDVALVCPPTAEDAVRATSLLRSGVEAAGFDFGAALMTFPRHAILVCLIAFDRDDQGEREAVAELVPSMIRRARAEGYGCYRGHVAFQSLIAEQYDFNDHALPRLHRTLKAALDPSGVLSPGKQGVFAESRHEAVAR